MGKAAGYAIGFTPCCGSILRVKRYSFLDFTASAFWTDGYREGSLSPVNYGLRKCTCGDYYLLSELFVVSHAEHSDLPDTLEVLDKEISTAVQTARTMDVERAARLCFWICLNHPYREEYRLHREAEEAARLSVNLNGSHGRLGWLDKIFHRERQKPHSENGNRVTFPQYHPSPQQRDNMRRLLDLMEMKDARKEYLVAIAELHRELGDFDRAEASLREILPEDCDTTVRLIANLVGEKVSAPVRYRM